jgi:hypothetical protein
MFDFIPQARADLAEQLLAFGVPHPPQVVSQLAQPPNAPGKAKMIGDFPFDRIVHGYFLSILNSEFLVRG